MSSSSGRPNQSPFAARASTRAPFPSQTGGAPSSAASPSPVAETPATEALKAAGKKTARGLFAAAALLLVAAVVGVFFLTRPGDDRSPAAPAESAPVAASVAEKPAEPPEAPAARAARLEKAFAAVQAGAADLSFDDASRAALADATLLASQARARAEAKDFDGAALEWEKALAGAGPVVVAAATVRYEGAAAALRDLRLEDQSAPEARALAAALAAADEARRREDWAAAIARREEARALVPATREAVAAQLSRAAKDAAARGDAPMATLFHERALRLDAGLAASRDYLYRNKFKPGQIVRTSDGAELAYAPPAEFLRGSPAGEPGRDADETRQRVTLTKGFFIAVHETTQREWDRVLGAGAAVKTLRAARARPETFSPDLPMHSVTWEQAADYCRRLSQAEGRSFRLPTEAEWEHACRAGTTSAFNLGVDGLSARDANIDDGTSAVPLAPRAPGASGRPNTWGLHDMHGNVWEWCADWSAPYPVAVPALVDPAGPARESLGRIDLALKVVRGGGWNAPANDARSANRWEYAPAVATGYIGFRVVLEPDLTGP